MLLMSGMSKEYELNSINAFRTRLAYLKMTDDMQPDIYLSLVANKQIGMAGFKLRLKAFFGHLDRTYLGPKWQKKSRDERTDGIGFVEKVKSHIHAHFAIRTPANAYLCNMKVHTENIWNVICPSGTYDVQMITARWGLTGYNTKEQEYENYDWHDQVVYVRDFAT